MINAGILDGDLVIVRPQQDAPDGTIVVAMVEDEATVKRLDRSRGRVRLLAENPAYAPIEPEQTEMVGEVRGLLRTYA
jgi:repressor LexA